ncbi:MAG TPA: tRNA 2-selenouridine(34) synthase MnmH [Aeromonadales bacterium]|nr:tRNA 2-selenouridine(34) synthase MnmH [Aeromonadales bacterium]
MLTLIQPSEFKSLFLKDTPLLDVRAEVEFKKGSFPAAVNIPILNDAERDKVGRCYKQRGQDAAVSLGHQLVKGDIKLHRVLAWSNFCQQNPKGALYCFRGGMRSALTQQWLADTGINYPRIAGGYKAMRNFLLQQIDQFQLEKNMVIVAGRTGTGKTRVIHAVDHSLDLEKYANHRGSAFGQFPSAQPSQINFENNLAIDILKKCQQFPATDTIFAIEDESRLIGRNALPVNFKNKMSTSPSVLVEESIESRIQVVIEEYVTQLSQMYLDEDIDNGWSNYCHYMLGSIDKISKRLGGVLALKIAKEMQLAFLNQEKNNDLSQHENWIKPLLQDYYDKMYDYQLNKKNQQVLFKGSRIEVTHYLKS